MIPHPCSFGRCRRQGGSVSVEYLLVASLAGAVLLIGQPSPVEQLLGAMAEQFRLFSVLVALP